MTKALACAWAKDNVQVNAILPGWIDTPLTQAARKVILRKGDCTAAINARLFAPILWITVDCAEDVRSQFFGPPVSLAREISMPLKERLAAERQRWKPLSAYQKFEHAVILVLTALIAVVVVVAVWNLVLKVLLSIISIGFDPTDYEVFQAFFGMIFTVIIALEFKRSLLVVAERRHGIVQVRTVLLIALLAIVRKLMIIDLSAAEAQQVFALAAAILALGAVYWLVREQDRREQHA
jgi:uncharacterized membrane protein (DUF373 family)